MKLAPFAVAALLASAPAVARAEDEWFGPDKALHFGISAGIAGGGYAIGAALTPDYAGRIALGASLALGAGLAKEIADALGLGTPSWKDFTWDVVGTSVGVGVSVLFDVAVRGGGGPRRK